jgi:hypothetical protein
MQRLKDYSNFLIWFAGLGYGLLRLFAGDFELPLALHAAGLAAVVFMLTQLVLRFLQRAAGEGGAIGGPPRTAPHACPPPPLPSVKPRAQFGLRGGRR